MYIRICCRTHAYTLMLSRKLHISDKHTPRMHRCCPLWSSSPPPGNNSKSRVINPSPVSSFPAPSSFSPLVCLHARVCVLMRVYSPPLPVHLSISNQSLSLAQARIHTNMYFYPLASPQDRYMCMMCIVANCSHANGHVPTGLIEDPLELP